MSVNKKCARECIEYIMGYKQILVSRQIAEAELADARHEFNDTRMAQLAEKIAGYDDMLADIEYTADNYSPLDVKPYRGHTFWTERAFLRCRFILGASTERTAELMDLSSATVYRIGKYVLGAVEDC